MEFHGSICTFCLGNTSLHWPLLPDYGDYVRYYDGYDYDDYVKYYDDIVVRLQDNVASERPLT